MSAATNDDLWAGTGWRVELPCPMKRCKGEVLYNGNYFCSNFGYTSQAGKRIGGPCNWALSHGEDGEPVGKRDREMWELIQMTDFYRRAMAGRRP